MSLDPTWLFLSLIPGALGVVLLAYGKKQGRWTHVVAGLMFLVYPYFTPGVVSLVATGGAIGAGLWYAVRAGW